MTHSDFDHEGLHQGIRDLVVKDLGTVVSVNVTEDYDDSGDLFFKILVEVEGSAADFVRDRPAGLRRKLRAWLLDANIDAFPSLSFKTAGDNLS